MQGPLRAGVFVVVAVTLLGFVPFPGHALVPSATHPRALSGEAREANSPSGKGGISSSGSESELRGLAKVDSIERGLAARGVDPGRVHFPNFPDAVTDPHQPVAPLYTSAPAPMGVADIGVRDVGGVSVPYELNTTSVEGVVNITDLRSLYVDGAGPTTYGVQLNSVVNNVTIFGNSSYQFWSQNYVDYTPETQQLIFGDEVWNFSDLSGNFPSSSVYAYGPNGTLAELPFLYQGYGPTIVIGYPFTLTLFLNTSLIDGRPGLWFNYTVANATSTQSASYDFLVFNSSAGAGAPPVPPVPVYQADGYAYDPIGLTNDMEIDVLGNDDGDMTSFLSANATVALLYWNGTAGRMETVPSAINAGQETGETSNGLLVVSNGATDPVALLRTGPSFVAGLWNSTNASVGATPLRLTLRPSNAFVFVNAGNSTNAPAEQWVPTAPTGVTTLYLPAGGSYELSFLFSEHNPATRSVSSSAPGALTVVLGSNLSRGIYTPMFALSNAQLANLSLGGVGTAGDPYHLYANQYGSLAPQFAVFDDFLFPGFPGLLLVNTTAAVDVSPASFELSLPSWSPSSRPGLPPSDDLQLELLDTSNVSVLNGTSISGWFSSNLNDFPEASLMIWGSTNDLVAGNTFANQGSSIFLYGGGNNTIWGNTFLPAPPAGADPTALMNDGVATDVNESESNDTIYDNSLTAAFPATTPTTDPVACDQYGLCLPVTYIDRWNVSAAPANATTVVNGVPLAGNILGGNVEGGNFWSNYGAAGNPYNVLPYNDSGWIASGGDFLPLLPSPLYAVTVLESGLPAGTSWSATADGVTTVSNSTSLGFELPAGLYAWTVAGPANYGSNASPLLSLLAGNVTVWVGFYGLAAVSFTEGGLPGGAAWSVTIRGGPAGNETQQVTSSSTPALDLVTNVTYNATATSVGYVATPAFLQFDLSPSGYEGAFNFSVGNGTLEVRLNVAPSILSVDGVPHNETNADFSLELVSGLHAVVVSSGGFATYFDNVSIAPARVTYLNASLTRLPGTNSTAPVGTSNNTSQVANLTSEVNVLEGAVGLLVIVTIVLLIDIALRGRRPPPPPPPTSPYAPGSATYQPYTPPGAR